MREAFMPTWLMSLTIIGIVWAFILLLQYSPHQEVVHYRAKPELGQGTTYLKGGLIQIHFDSKHRAFDIQGLQLSLGPEWDEGDVVIDSWSALKREETKR